MAVPSAYEQPTINRAWQDFVNHIPTFLLIWIVTLLIAAIGFVAYLILATIGIGLAGGSSSDSASTLGLVLGQLGQLPFSILSSLVGVLFIAVPAIHYESGEVVTVGQAFKALLHRPLRYLLAGALFSIAMVVGLLFCILPGIAVALVAPVYVNRIFNTDAGVLEAFGASFQSVYRSQQGFTFVWIQILTWLVVMVVSICTCGLAALIAVPVSTFYVQNVAYNRGILS